MKTVGIHTLGCRVNQYESVAIAEKLESLGFTVRKDSEVCDFYIINTCSVTAESQRQSRQTVRKYASVGKTAVLGCASQNEKQSFLSIPNVFYVGGCSDKLAVVDALLREEENSPTDAVRDMNEAMYEPMFVSGQSDLFSSCRAFLKIQDGCNGKCSYCIIPSLRGRVRIRPTEEIYEETCRLVQAGYHEVVLTGIEVSAYPMDRLCALLKQLDGLLEQGLWRVRFGSLSPRSLQEPFLQTLAQTRNVMPHVHLSLQSGSDRILALMRRPYTAMQAMEGIKRLKQAVPQVQLSADFITGFPTETEEDHLQTEAFIRQAGLMHVHAFPYSERQGTPAAEMQGSIPHEERKRRTARLNSLADAQREALFASLKGTQVTVLTEKVVGETALGHTEAFMEIQFPASGAEVGECYRLSVVGAEGGRLLGKRTEGGSV